MVENLIINSLDIAMLDLVCYPKTNKKNQHIYDVENWLAIKVTAGVL